MAIPEQVQKQSADVAKLYKDMGVDPDTGAPVEPTEPVVAAVPDTPVVVPDSEPGQAPAPPPDEHAGEGGQDDESFEQKYRTLQGMYNADVPRLNASNRDLGSRISQLEGLLSSVAQQPPAGTPNAGTAPQPQSLVLINDQDKEDYGDSIEVMRKASREETAPLIQRIVALEGVVQQLQSNIVPRVESIAKRQAQTSEQSYWTELGTAVPEWKTINASPDFQSWLLDIDPLTGHTRQTLLEHAQQQLDAIRTASFFTSWLKESGVTVSQPTPDAASSELERQIVPGRGRTAAPPAPVEGKIYTRQDIADFFDDVRVGKFRGQEDERNRIERDIFAAQQEGRIQ